MKKHSLDVNHRRKIFHRKGTKKLPIYNEVHGQRWTSPMFKSMLWKPLVCYLGALILQMVRKLANPGLFLFIFVLFPFQFIWQMYNLNNINWKKCRRCVWDSNPGRQDGRQRRIHCAMAAPPYCKWFMIINCETECKETFYSVQYKCRNLQFNII